MRRILVTALNTKFLLSNSAQILFQRGNGEKIKTPRWSTHFFDNPTMRSAEQSNVFVIANDAVSGENFVVEATAEGTMLSMLF